MSPERLITNHKFHAFGVGYEERSTPFHFWWIKHGTAPLGENLTSPKLYVHLCSQTRRFVPGGLSPMYSVTRVKNVYTCIASCLYSPSGVWPAGKEDLPKPAPYRSRCRSAPLTESVPPLTPIASHPGEFCGMTATGAKGVTPGLGVTPGGRNQAEWLRDLEKGTWTNTWRRARRQTQEQGQLCPSHGQGWDRHSYLHQVCSKLMVFLFLPLPVVTWQ